VANSKRRVATTRRKDFFAFSFLRQMPCESGSRRSRVVHGCNLHDDIPYCSPNSRAVLFFALSGWMRE
jgi:hypothetical protein